MKETIPTDIFIYIIQYLNITEILEYCETTEALKEYCSSHPESISKIILKNSGFIYNTTQSIKASDLVSKLVKIDDTLGYKVVMKILQDNDLFEKYSNIIGSVINSLDQDGNPLLFKLFERKNNAFISKILSKYNNYIDFSLKNKGMNSLLDNAILSENTILLRKLININLKEDDFEKTLLLLFSEDIELDIISSFFTSSAKIISTYKYIKDEDEDTILSLLLNRLNKNYNSDSPDMLFRLIQILLTLNNYISEYSLYLLYIYQNEKKSNLNYNENIVSYIFSILELSIDNRKKNKTLDKIKFYIKNKSLKKNTESMSFFKSLENKIKDEISKNEPSSDILFYIFKYKVFIPDDLYNFIYKKIKQI